MSSKKFRPIILAGGSGKRLWPLSTKQRPKQFISLFVYMCFPGAQFVNKFIFQIAFWDTLCVLVLFLLIGVGCDSCFVFYDNFKHSRVLAADRTEDPTTIMTLRLKYALGHSRKGVGVAAGTSGGALSC